MFPLNLSASFYVKHTFPPYLKDELNQGLGLSGKLLKVTWLLSGSATEESFLILIVYSFLNFNSIFFCHLLQHDKPPPWTLVASNDFLAHTSVGLQCGRGAVRIVWLCSVFSWQRTLEGLEEPQGLWASCIRAVVLSVTWNNCLLQGPFSSASSSVSYLGRLSLRRQSSKAEKKLFQSGQGGLVLA